MTRRLIVPLALLAASPAWAGSLVFKEFGQYGTATTFYLSFDDPADADDLYTGTDIVAGDCKISKDGGAVASTTNLPTQVTASQPIYSLALTAAEMQATRIHVTCRDQTATEVFSPIVLFINTRMSLGTLTVDATQIGGSNAAVTLQGVGASQGLSSVGGVTGVGIYAQGGSTSGHGLVAESRGGTTYGIYALKSAGGGAAFFADASGATNATGFTAQGSGTASGASFQGGTTGHGINAQGGATSGDGIRGNSQAGANAGIHALSGGTGSAAFIAESTAAAATNVPAFYLRATGASAAIDAQGGQTGEGAKIVGGTTSGVGALVQSSAGNSNGVTLQGVGTGDGLRVIGGATGNGIHAQGGSTSGAGIVGAAQAGNSNGFTGTKAGTGRITNFLQDTYADPSGAPVAGTTNLEQAMGYLMARFYNKVTQTSSQQKVFKTDDSTVTCTATTSDDGTTQTKGKCN